MGKEQRTGTRRETIPSFADQAGKAKNATVGQDIVESQALIQGRSSQDTHEVMGAAARESGP